MKFLYILSSENKTVGVFRIAKPPSIIPKDKIQDVLNGANPTEIILNKRQIEMSIDELINLRKESSLYVPDYKGRFKEEEVFEHKTFKGKRLKLCNSGPDSYIIFLINLLNSMTNDETRFKLLTVNNHREADSYLSKEL